MAQTMSMALLLAYDTVWLSAQDLFWLQAQDFSDSEPNILPDCYLKVQAGW